MSEQYSVIPESYANAIFDVLVQYAGASERVREQFLVHRKEITEFRFGGSLGFGGKVWNNRIGWYVTYYKEDASEERNTICNETNARLADLWLSFRRGEMNCPDRTTTGK